MKKNETNSFYLAIGLEGLSRIIVRGGANFIDVSYIDSDIDEDLHFLDNDRLRKIIHDLYPYTFISVKAK